MERALRYEKAYVEGHLLAYIGNKRRLIPLLLRAVSEAERQLRKQGVGREGTSNWFVDYFSGTGVVSRLAKSLGYNVLSNDWEDYAHIVGKAFVEANLSPDELFADEGGLQSVLQRLNALSRYRKKDAYISTYYCPGSDEKPNPETERMFYTRRNGVLIDNIRSAIDAWFPKKSGKKRSMQRNVLLGLLLHQASKRSNTSGVFKGFHRGFGGRKADALGRILSPVALEAPVLSANKPRCKVFCSDALRLSRRLRSVRVGIVYLDPPYNQHQYGSNYHLLNTIARNDRPSLRRGFWVDGKKIQKSGIRRDWVRTKSTFCCSRRAEADFRALVRNINAHMLLVSYSTEGVIPFDVMMEILSSKGKLGIVASPYTRYRGGRQSNTTKTSNIEFVLMVDANRRSSAKDLRNVKGVLMRHRFWNVLSETFPFYKPNPKLFTCSWRDGKATVRLESFGIEVPLTETLRMDASLLDVIGDFSYARQEALHGVFRRMFCATNSEEVSGLCGYLLRHPNAPARKALLERLFRLYIKIHPGKNPESFAEATAAVENILPILEPRNEVPWMAGQVERNFGSGASLFLALQARLGAAA